MKSLIAASTVATQIAISPAFCQECVLIHSYDFSMDARDGTGIADGVMMEGASVSNGQLLTNGISGYVQFSENIIPVTLELGGKSPNIFFDDVMRADDGSWDKAQEGFAMFALNQGEVCTCPSRALIQESIAGDFLDAVVERTERITRSNDIV
jgi:hypothetical protein